MHGASGSILSCLVIIWNKSMNSTDDFAKRVEAAIKNPKNLGELDGADAVGTVGSEDCGDMLRMWVKFKEVDAAPAADVFYL
jgi:hypothetical protein